MLSVKQGSITYYFLSLWYDLTGDWTPVSRIISEHFTHLINEPVEYSIIWTWVILLIFNYDDQESGYVHWPVSSYGEIISAVDDFSDPWDPTMEYFWKK